MGSATKKTLTNRSDEPVGRPYPELRDGSDLSEQEVRIRAKLMEQFPTLEHVADALGVDSERMGSSRFATTLILGPGAPGIVTAGRDLQDPIHGADGKLPSVLFNKRVSQRGQLLKIPTAFIWKAFSSLRRVFSRWERANSLSCGLPLPAKARSLDFSNYVFHLRSRLWWMPMSRATWLWLPVSSAKRRAWRLNSFEKVLRVAMAAPRCWSAYQNTLFEVSTITREDQ